MKDDGFIGIIALFLFSVLLRVLFYGAILAIGIWAFSKWIMPLIGG